MFFKKKAPPQTRRTRQPSASNGAANRAVFSYHANRAPRPDGGTERRPGGLAWTGDSTPKSSPRAAAGKPWFKRVSTVIAMALLLGLALYSLTLSRNPQVVALEERQPGRATLLRAQQTYEDAAREALRSSLGNTNKLTINTKDLAEDLKRKFPELAEVSIALPLLGRQPIVYIQPAEPTLLLKTVAGGVFVLDRSGVALANASHVAKIEKMGLPLVDDQADLPVDLGSAALPSSNVAFITEVVGQLKAKKLAVSSATLPRGTSELHLRLEALPYTVKFNLRGDARTGAGAFLATKKHLEGEGKTPSSYIDVRVDNRVYYK